MKKSMNANALLLGVLLIGLSFGCSLTEESDAGQDDTPASAYYLKAKVNGVLVNFTDESLQLVSIGSTLPGIFEAGISASSSASDQSGISQAITLAIKDDSPIGVKTYDYLRPFTETGFGLKGLVLGYFNASENAQYVTDVDEEDSILQITELSNTQIKGKFSGKIYDILTGNSKNITEGEFVLKVDNMN